MSLLTLSLFLFLSLVFLLLGRNRLAIVFQIFSFLLIIGLGYHPLPSFLLNNIQSEPYNLQPKWSEKNLIVVLGIGTQVWSQNQLVKTASLGYPRLFEGARLYFDCLKHSTQCTLLLSGGDPLKRGITEAEVMKLDLLSIQIPEKDILVEDKSLNTFQNAMYSSKIIDELKPTSVYLVSSGLHLKRAQLYFRHFERPTIGAPADFVTGFKSQIPLSAHLFLMDRTLHEFIGIIRYNIYNLLGLNMKPGQAGSP